jgi:hypothetical protein
MERSPADRHREARRDLAAMNQILTNARTDLNRRFNITGDIRQQMVDTAAQMMLSPLSSPRTVEAGVKTLLEMEKLNQIDERVVAEKSAEDSTPRVVILLPPNGTEKACQNESDRLSGDPMLSVSRDR